MREHMIQRRLFRWRDDLDTPRMFNRCDFVDLAGTLPHLARQNDPQCVFCAISYFFSRWSTTTSFMLHFTEEVQSNQTDTPRICSGHPRAVTEGWVTCQQKIWITFDWSVVYLLSSAMKDVLCDTYASLRHVSTTKWSQFHNSWRPSEGHLPFHTHSKVNPQTIWWTLQHDISAFQIPPEHLINHSHWILNGRLPLRLIHNDPAQKGHIHKNSYQLQCCLMLRIEVDSFGNGSEVYLEFVVWCNSITYAIVHQCLLYLNLMKNMNPIQTNWSSSQWSL